METKEIKITPPEGYEIDKENSTFDCIKFKPVTKRWRNTNPVVAGYYISGSRVKLHNGEWNNDNYDIFAKKEQAISALAMAQISQIMANDERFGGVVTYEEWDNDSLKYIIERHKNEITTTNYYHSYRFLAFHTRKQRDLFIKENEDLIKDYFMIE